MTEHSISINFKARYFASEEITSTTKQIVFVLHGYGQLAQYFVRKFHSLSDYHTVVIAPEGLSKFYLEPIEGIGRKNSRVGATWMTKENRQTDIDNYLTYLDAVFAEVMRSSPSNLKVTVLGFSQGSATASRWILSPNIRFDRLILWAGILPPDMNFETGGEVLKNKEVVFAYGKQDPFLTDARFTEMKELVERLKTKVEIVSFDGGHDIDEKTLVGLFGG